MSNLERRYARLLRLYPAAYRAERGPELLDALLQAEPGPREVRALIFGALRAHAAHVPSPLRDWLTAFRAAALMLLVSGIVGLGMQLSVPYENRRFGVATLVLTVLALASAVGGRYLLAAIATVAATATAAGSGFGLGLAWQLPLAALLLVPLHWRRPGSASGVLRYVPLLPVLLVAADELFTHAFPAVSGILQRGLLMGVVVAALLWLAVDERVPMAVGLLFLNTLLVQVAYLVATGQGNLAARVLQMAFVGLPPVILLTSASARSRQQATV
jgi:hypothetical protein